MQGESWTGEMEEEERIEERSEEGREGADFSQENASQRRLDPDFRNPQFRNLDGTWRVKFIQVQIPLRTTHHPSIDTDFWNKLCFFTSNPSLDI